MQLHSIELRCPYCHAAQALATAGQHTCEYCLRGFTAVDADAARERTTAAVSDWLSAQVGGSQAAEVVDLTSRVYIFRERILPELSRDCARALEGLGAWLQAPLVIARLVRPAGERHPLLGVRQRMQHIVQLHARLEHEHICRFAVDDESRRELSRLSAPLAQLIHLINVVEASARGQTDDWRAVRGNLEALMNEPDSEPVCSGFATLVRERWRQLAELAGCYEQLSAGPSMIATIEKHDQLAASLRQLAEQLRECPERSTEAMAISLAVDREAAGAVEFGRWLRCQAGLPGARSLRVEGFVDQLGALLSSYTTNEQRLGVLECWTTLASAARHETPVLACDDFSWIDGWVAAERRVKRFGVLGVDEQLVAIERFMLPVWVIEVACSRQHGRILGGGVEQRMVGLLDACASTTAKLALLDPGQTWLSRALGRPGPIGAVEIALPSTDSGTAHAIVARALGERPELRNPRFGIRGLALLPAATARFSSTRGYRDITASLAGTVPTCNYARERVDAGRWLFSTFNFAG